MNSFYFYMLQSAVSMVVLYLVYWLFLKKDTFFAINRFYLVGSILFSLLFPLFRLNLNLQDSDATFVVLLDTITITPDKIEAAVASRLSLFTITTVIYLTGVSLFFLRFLIQFYQVFRLSRKEGLPRQEGIRLVFIDRNYQPFSFFRLIFIPESLKETQNLTQIIEHERIHVRQNHSLDLILLELLTIFQWFNPVIWLYRRSIKSIHEYLADEGVVLKGFDRIEYQELLLGQSLGIQVNDLTNNFNHSLLKSRIIMMTKQRSGTFSGWKTAMAAPLILGLAAIFSTPVNTGMAKEIPNAAQAAQYGSLSLPVELSTRLNPLQDTLKKSSSQEKVYEMVNTMPSFEGGFDALANYLVTNIKYPEEAKKNKITGTVFVSFVIKKDGTVSNATILKSVNPLLDAEALRVVKGMPKWKPGLNDEGIPVNVQFNLPIKFSLQEEPNKKEEK